MTHLYDADLEFLKNCPNDDLRLLCDVLTKDTDGNDRSFTSDLLGTDAYKNYPHNIKAIVPEIIHEIQSYGGNTLANIFRGHGVNYREIVMDVCDQQKVNYNKSNSTPMMEQYLLQKLVVSALDKMNDEDVKNATKGISKYELLKNVDVLLKVNSPLLLQLTIIAVQQIATKMGAKLLGGALGEIIGGRVFAAFAGPIGWAISAAWALWDIAGPAYRVTFPTVIVVAYLRMKSQMTDEEFQQLFN